MSDLTAAQQFDILETIWQRCPELRPVYLYPDGVSWTIRKQPNGEIVWLPIDADPAKSSGMTNVIAAHFLDVCISKMLRRLNRHGPVLIYEYSETSGRCVSYGVPIGYRKATGATLIQALAAACAAVLDAKEPA